MHVVYITTVVEKAINYQILNIIAGLRNISFHHIKIILEAASIYIFMFLKFSAYNTNQIN